MLKKIVDEVVEKVEDAVNTADEIVGDVVKTADKISDEFWYDNPEVLLLSDKLTEFFPHKSFSLNEKLNSIVRLSLYISIVLIFYYKNIKWGSIFIFILLSFKFFFFKFSHVVSYFLLIPRGSCTTASTESSLIILNSFPCITNLVPAFGLTRIKSPF